jgi:hypothetical protein
VTGRIFSKNCCVSQTGFEDDRKCLCAVTESNPEAISSFTGCKIARVGLRQQRNDTRCYLSVIESKDWDSGVRYNPAAETFLQRQGQKSFASTGLPTGIAVKNPATKSKIKLQSKKVRGFESLRVMELTPQLQNTKTYQLYSFGGKTYE